MKRILFIINSTDMTYGASKSLGILLKNLKIEYDIIYPNSIFFKAPEQKIRQYAGEYLRNIYSFFLPSERCSIGFEKVHGIKKIAVFLREKLWYLDKYKIKRLIKKNNYDIVHLNCNNLSPLIDDKANYIIHIREIADKENKHFSKFQHQLEKAMGVIFIDKTVRNYISANMKNEKIIMNPVDMCGLNKVSVNDALIQLNLDQAIKPEDTVFSIIGSLLEMKGVHRVIKAFNENDLANCKLLIVGGGNSEYSEKCRTEAKKNPNIILYGEMENAALVYRISDFIIRGEPFFALGRTAYEGLYSGCGIIIPGSEKENGEDLFDYLNFKDRVFWYSPGNEKKLGEKIQELSGKKIRDKKFIGNSKEYVEQFCEFAEEVIKGRKNEN